MCVLLCFIEPILGNRYGSEAFSGLGQGARNGSPTYHLALFPLLKRTWGCWILTLHLDYVSRIWFLVCYAATPQNHPLHQERIHVVRSNRVARQRPEGTPAMDLGHMNVVLMWCTCMLIVDWGIGMVIITVLRICLCVLRGFRRPN